MNFLWSIYMPVSNAIYPAICINVLVRICLLFLPAKVPGYLAMESNQIKFYTFRIFWILHFLGSSLTKFALKYEWSSVNYYPISSRTFHGSHIYFSMLNFLEWILSDGVQRSSHLNYVLNISFCKKIINMCSLIS